MPMSEDTAFDFIYDHIEGLRLGGRLVLTKPTWADGIDHEKQLSAKVVGLGGEFSVPALEEHFIGAVQDPTKIKVASNVTAADVEAAARSMADLLQGVGRVLRAERVKLFDIRPLRPQLQALF